MDCSMPGLPVHHQLPEFTQTHVHRVSGAIQLSHPLSSPSPLAFNLSQHQGLFSSLHQVALKYWSFSFNIRPSNEYSGLISFRIDWFELLAVQGTLQLGWDLIPPNRLSHLRISHTLTLRSTYQDSFFTVYLNSLSLEKLSLTASDGSKVPITASHCTPDLPILQYLSHWQLLFQKFSYSLDYKLLKDKDQVKLSHHYSICPTHHHATNSRIKGITMFHTISFPRASHFHSWKHSSQ